MVNSNSRVYTRTYIRNFGSVVDRLRVLWAICLVQHYRERNIPPSPYTIKQDFGDHIYSMWKIACDLAHHYKLLDSDRMLLTPKGLAAVNNWQSVSDHIMLLP